MTQPMKGKEKQLMILKNTLKWGGWLLTGFLFICLLFIPQETLADNSVSIKLDTAYALPGSEVSVPIVIQSNSGFASLKFQIHYDDSQITLTDVTFPRNTGTYSSVPEPYSADQVINFVSPLSAFTKTNTFATLTFMVNDDAVLDSIIDILVDFEQDDVFDMDFNDVDLSVLKGAICISEGGSPENPAMIPASVTVIEAEAFMNTSFSYIILPETATTIYSKAFANCGNLRYIYIPESVTSIADDAFLNVTELTIYGKEGSYAALYADRKGYQFHEQ